jgi:mannose-6-phosphate isomerase-like protein (cupin superfamily)
LPRPLAGHTLGDPDGSFVIAEWTAEGAPPSPPRWVAPLHLHREDDEAWYVLEGRLVFRVGDEEVEAGAGEAVYVPRGTPHTFWNPGEEQARYVIVMTANTFRLVQAIHATTDADLESLRALFEQYGAELL